MIDVYIYIEYIELRLQLIKNVFARYFIENILILLMENFLNLKMQIFSEYLKTKKNGN